MCPVCFATVAWIAASATSTGGTVALAVNRLRGRDNVKDILKERDHGIKVGGAGYDGADDDAAAGSE